MSNKEAERKLRGVKTIRKYEPLGKCKSLHGEEKQNKFGEKEDEEMRQMLRDQFTAQTIRSNLLYLFMYFFYWVNL